MNAMEHNLQLALRPLLKAKSTADMRVQGVETFSRSRGPKGDYKAIQRLNFERLG
jgi:hypothetical protein